MPVVQAQMPVVQVAQRRRLPCQPLGPWLRGLPRGAPPLVRTAPSAGQRVNWPFCWGVRRASRFGRAGGSFGMALPALPCLAAISSGRQAECRVHDALQAARGGYCLLMVELQNRARHCAVASCSQRCTSRVPGCLRPSARAASFRISTASTRPDVSTPGAPFCLDSFCPLPPITSGRCR